MARKPKPKLSPKRRLLPSHSSCWRPLPRLCRKLRKKYVTPTFAVLDVFDAICSGDLPFMLRWAGNAKKREQPGPEFWLAWKRDSCPHDTDDVWLAEVLAVAGFLHPAPSGVDIWIWWPEAKKLWFRSVKTAKRPRSGMRGNRPRTRRLRC
jgi:hypothetical protein